MEASVLGLVDNSHATATELFDHAIMGNCTANQFRSTDCYHWLAWQPDLPISSSAGDSMKCSATFSVSQQ